MVVRRSRKMEQRTMKSDQEHPTPASNHSVVRAMRMQSSAPQVMVEPGTTAPNASKHDESYWDALDRLEDFDPLE
jgi:hypothetical protein